MPNPTQSPSDDLVKTLDTIGLDTGIDGVRTFDTETLAAFIESQKAQWEREAEVRGMQKAKSRVLRRTEIPADAKKPTRDIVVVVGEECARIIQQDIDELARLSDTGELEKSK